jgi:hypothetical protein
MQLPRVFDQPGAMFVLMRPSIKFPPFQDAWQLKKNAHTFKEAEAHLATGGNVGVLGGNCFIGLDKDVPEAFTGIELPPTTTWETRPGRLGMWFRCDESLPELLKKYGKKANLSQFKLFLNGKGVGEIKLERSYQVIPPSHKFVDPTTGKDALPGVGQKIDYKMIDSRPPEKISLEKLLEDLQAAGIRFNQVNKEDKPITSPLKTPQATLEPDKQNPYESMEAEIELERQKRYARAAFVSEMKKFSETVEGNRNNQLNISTYQMAGFVASGLLDTDSVGFVIRYIAYALDTEGIEETMLSAFNSGKLIPRYAPDKTNEETEIPAPSDGPDFNFVTKESPAWSVGLNRDTGLIMKVVVRKNKETEESFTALEEVSECALRIDTETIANRKTEYTFRGIGAVDKREVCFNMPAEDMAVHAKFKAAVINAFGAQNHFGKLNYPIVQDCSRNRRLKTRIEVPTWKDGLPMMPGMEYPGIEYRLPSQIPAKVYDGDITEAIIVLQKAMRINKFAPVLIATILGAPIFARWFKTERFGLGIWGLTNSLKTSTVCALMSIWGVGYMDGPTLKSGRAGTTAYAATVIFASAGWLPQILDNVKTVDPRDAIDYIGTINAVLEGSSKNQGTKDGGLRDSMEYCCTPIVTGEVRPQETATTSRVPAIQWDGVDANLLLEIQTSVSVMPVIGYHWLKHLMTVKTIDRASFDAYRTKKRDEFIAGGHMVAGRTATIYSMIKLAWAMLEVSSFGEVFRENEKRFMSALDDLAKSQGENTDEETESARFVSGVKELMLGRQDLFQDQTGMNAGPKIIGRIMPDQMETKGLPEGVWLLPIETLSELGKIKAFTQIPTIKSMTEALDQAGLLVGQGGKRKYQMKINGVRVYGWYIKMSVPSEENDSGERTKGT